MSLNSQMRKAFQLQHQPEYFPHCSLLYADLPSEAVHEQIQEMQRCGTTEITSSGGFSFGRQQSKMTSMRLGSIQLWDTNGPVSDWSKIKSVDL
jgi:hypothetical protein